MKISKIYIGDYKQFKRLELDFTHPVTGEPLDKICFIGRNGTGKSNLLELIRSALRSYLFGNGIVLKVNVEGHYFFAFWSRIEGMYSFLKIAPANERKFIQSYFDFLELFKLTGSRSELMCYIDTISENERNEIGFLKPNTFYEKLYQGSSLNKLLIHVHPEGNQSSYSQIDDVPETTLNEALELFNAQSSIHDVSPDYVSEFWQQLNYLIKKREDDRNQFEELPENLSKVKSELIELFRKDNPEILQKLAELWNKILDSADLEFDYKRAKNPVQLTDNLKAYIIHKKTGKVVKYSELSTGIRNFIFKIGHIYSLYFNRKIDQGFLLVDEPENSLFPDFLYDLIDIYKEITTDKDGNNNTQMFFATHSPIIAAQFEPYERVILEWNDEGTISAHRGVAPVGDDPNDVLEKDFKIQNLMNVAGQKVWEEYLELKKQLRRTSDQKQKDELVDKITKIGHDYNFEE